MPYERLPLFPLNIVLFPRMSLPLHIFEERYQAMIRHCLETDSPFGVILIQEGEEVGTPAIPQRIGTLAQIQAVQHLTEGRMNILTMGTQRFRLLDYDVAPEAYLIGEAEPLQDEPFDPAVMESLVAELKTLFEEFFRLLVERAGVEAPEYELPETPEDLSFVIASIMQIPLEQRQRFLEMTDTAARLQQERAHIEMMIERLKSMPAQPTRRVIQAQPVKPEELKSLFSPN
jgi:Lon protease-like protein